MKSNFTLPSLVLVVMSAALLVLSGCSDNGSNNKGGGSTPPPATPTTTIFPAINPPFDEITEVAVSPDPGGPFDDVLEPDTDYTYDPATESITSTSSVDPGGAYVRITGLATVTGTQSSYTVYTYIASGGVQVAANELTSAAVGLVASGDAADFNAALTLVENEFGLPMGSAAEAVPADQRSAELTSVLAAAAPAFASGADPAFDVADFNLADLTEAQGGYVECVAQGGLAWDSWHKTDAGGSNLPPDEGDNDYTRCKACHGWDQQGTDGGYVRRSRNDGRANAGYQDPNNCDLEGADPATCTPSRNISTDATFGRGSAIGIPAGGRTWAEGSAVFDMVDPDWGPGAILGNRHPDLSAANPGGPTAQQLSCLTAFLNAPEARAEQVYAAMDTVPADGNELVIYTPVTTADAVAGETYYDANCQGCHGDPSNDGVPDVGGLIAYLNSDGKFSEFMHKMHWGIPNTSMSRAAMGDPTAADVANVVAYMQAVPFMEISAAQVVPAIASIVARGSGTYTLTDSSLEYEVNVDDASLSGPITSATFNLGRVGTNGDPIYTLDAFASGQSQGVWEGPGPSAEQRTALLAGNVYVVIKTTANPEGEIRGQVKAVFAGVNQPPVADAGTDQDVDTGSEVTLNGSDSSDPDDGPLPLSYSWVLDTVPADSTATLANANTASPTFTADMDGTYTATLVVNDGADDSAPDSVTVTASAEPLDGAALYETNCAQCHNPLATSTKAGATAEDIQAAIDNNTGGMGGLSFLTAEEVQAIADALAL
jgi:cytochrome c2/cytochrome c553